MILVDANILLYAYDSSCPRHGPARAWLEETLSSQVDVRFALASVVAFLRIGTSPTVFQARLGADEAIEIVRGLMARPTVGIAQPTDRHWSILARVARTGQARGPLLMDAHLAALAIEHGATLCTTDRDFARFPRLRFKNPLGD